MYLSGLGLRLSLVNRFNLAASNQSCTVHYRTSSYITARNNCPDKNATIHNNDSWWWPLTISTYHVSFAAGHITKVVVSLFSEDGWSSHERDNLFVFRTPRVFQIPELDMSEKENSLMSLEKFWKFCASPVSCCDKVGPILRKANCLHFCGDFVTGDLEQSPFIDFPVVTCLYHETQDLDLDNECPRAQYSTSWSLSDQLFPMSWNPILSPPPRI